MVEGAGEAQAWQAPLWKALVEYTHELGQPRWHRANLISALSKRWSPRRPARWVTFARLYRWYFRVTAC
ncbi:hypothetical protein ACNKHL_17150 [Shigella flexneri]